MKIGLLSFEYPPETGFGGIGTYTWYHARALARLGHEVHVLAGATDVTAHRHTQHDGVHVHRFRGRAPWSQPLGAAAMWWTRNRLENAVNMRRLLSQVQRDVGFDILEMPECGAEGLLINHLRGGGNHATFVRLHSPAELIMPYYDVNRADRLACAASERLALMGADRITSCSRFLADAARARLGVRREVPVIPNGIDLSLFDQAEPVDIHAKFELPRERPLIVFAGRMEPRKGIQLCEAIVAPILERHEVAVAFAGQDLFGHLKDSVLPRLAQRRLRGSVHYLGKLSLLDVRACLRASDVFLLPSLWENCPYSCIEAMAAGCAVVSSDCGGMPELVAHGRTGLLAKTSDPAAFSAALEQLLEDPSLRERLARSARAQVETTLTDTLVAQRSVDHYQRCLAGA